MRLCFGLISAPCWTHFRSSNLEQAGSDVILNGQSVLRAYQELAAKFVQVRASFWVKSGCFHLFWAHFGRMNVAQDAWRKKKAARAPADEWGGMEATEGGASPHASSHTWS